MDEAKRRIIKRKLQEKGKPESRKAGEEEINHEFHE